MGFELDECQEALLAGHTTLESAVEWYAYNTQGTGADPGEGRRGYAIPWIDLVPLF